MNSHLALLRSDYCVEFLANSLLLAANFALYSNRMSTTCFVQDSIRSSLELAMGFAVLNPSYKIG